MNQTQTLTIPKTLTDLWDQNGTPLSERENTKTELLEMINSFIKGEIFKQEQVKEEHEDNITLEKANVDKLSNSLGMKTTLPGLEGKNLLETLNLVKSEKNHLMKIKNDREIEKTNIISQIVSICEELELLEDKKQFLELNKEDLRIEMMNFLKDSLHEIKEKKEIRKNEVISMSQEIFYLFKILGETKETSPTLKHAQKEGHYSISTIDDILWNPSEYESVPLGRTFLESIIFRRDHLKLEYTNRMTFLHAIMKEIQNLYKKLEIPIEEQIDSTDSTWESPTKLVMRELEMLFTELEEKKKVLLKEFIANALNELESLREELNLPNEEIYDEDDNLYYGMLEQEVERLKVCKEEFLSIKSVITKIEDLKKDLDEVNKSIYDPNRYKDSKRLFREEGIRKRAKVLPSLTAQIKQRILDFEEKHDVPVCFENVKYLDMIEKYENELAEAAPKRTSIMNRTSSELGISTIVTSSQTTNSKYTTPKSKLVTTKASTTVTKPPVSRKLNYTPSLKGSSTPVNKTLKKTTVLGTQKKPLQEKNL
jgi:hypothetical protein